MADCEIFNSKLLKIVDCGILSTYEVFMKDGKVIEMLRAYEPVRLNLYRALWRLVMQLWLSEPIMAACERIRNQALCENLGFIPKCIYLIANYIVDDPVLRIFVIHCSKLT